jgi:predicted transposase YdaD
MPDVTSVERFGIERGMQQGLEQGLEQGRQEGRQEGEISLLERLLFKRFGPLPPATRARLAQASTDQLERWAERLLDAQTLDAVFEEH